MGELRGASRSRALGVGSTNAQPSWPSPLHRRHGPSRAARARFRRRGMPCGLPCRLPRSAGSSLGVVKVRPSIGMGAWCPLPAKPLLRRAAARSAPEGAGRATRSHLRPGVATLRVSFRPCRSSRLRRLAPPGTSQVCCTLKPIVGFAMFPVVGSARLLPRGPGAFPPEGGASPRGFAVPCGSAPPCGDGALVASRRARCCLVPFPMARHPSELSPRRQLYRVSRPDRVAPRPPLPSRTRPGRLRRPGW